MTNDWPARFWARVAPPNADGCRLWQGRLQRNRRNRDEQLYGAFDVPGRRRNKAKLAHRVAYELTHGAIPDDKQVLHSCDTPLCCEPTHLFLGTHADNMADMVAKGRKPSRRGERNGRAKLTQADVDAIRARYTGRFGEKAALAREYGVSKTVIGQVLSGELWREVMPQSSEPNVYDEKVLTEDNRSSSRWRCCISAGGSSRREPARSPRRSCRRGGRSRTNDCGGSAGRSRTSRITG